jgi:hypothetical protein
MITITVRVCGDYWANPEEVRSQLDAIAGTDSIVLDLQAEGPGLGSLGIIDMLDDYCTKYHVDPAQISIDHWSNTEESVPYTVINPSMRSHFFDFSRNYWPEQITSSTHEYLFGFFIGRRTVPRLVALHYLFHKNNSLLSCLSTVNALPWKHQHSGVDLELIENWIDADRAELFCQWCESDPIRSLDGHSIRDQYRPGINTNLDILPFYSKFDIELVSESYTRGNTFFPTEKTIRPIAAAKPVLIYGPRKFLQRLKCLGFETYHSIWDESYDQLEGPDRWLALQHVIDFIVSMSESDRFQLLEKARLIAMQNRQHLASMIGIKIK